MLQVERFAMRLRIYMAVAKWGPFGSWANIGKFWLQELAFPTASQALLLDDWSIGAGRCQKWNIIGPWGDRCCFAA